MFHYLFIHLLLCAYTCMIWVHECGGTRHGICEEVRGQLLRFSPSTQGSQDQMQVTNVRQMPLLAKPSFQPFIISF